MSKDQSTTDQTHHRSNPIKSSKLTITGYPSKLIIFKIKASRYYWVRYFLNGKIYKRTTKAINVRDASEFAKRFYDEINYRKHVGLLRGNVINFVACVRELLKQQEYSVKAGEMSSLMAKADEYRFNKEIVGFFEDKRIDEINYTLLESFMNNLISKQLHASTINNYMGLISKTLKLAHRRELIKTIPQIPKSRRTDRARGWFTANEYLTVWRTAKRLVGRIYEIRGRSESNSNIERFTVERMAPNVFERAKLKNESQGKYELNESQVSHLKTIKNTKFYKKITISEDLSDVICFMINSFIRPTDLKFMKHKHVEIIRGESNYLRLNLPKSKKHDKPIATMSAAIRVYERVRDRNNKFGKSNSDDYVFLPNKRSDNESKNEQQRNAAIRELQQQFRIVLEQLNMLNGANEENRSLYSLRHSSIMFRLLYGKGVDHLTLAINARTSTDMLERFYVSHLTGEMNIEMLQSRRK